MEAFGTYPAEKNLLLPDVLSPPEITGRLGLNDVLVVENETDELADEMREYYEEIASMAQMAEDDDGLVESLVKVSEDIMGSLEVVSDSSPEIEKAYTEEQFWVLITDLLVGLDEAAGINNADVLLEFINDL